MGTVELPPRTRRIRPARYAASKEYGTTSAYAENTHSQARSQQPPRNYLRVRGEYPAASNPNHGNRELPPRTRRIPAKLPIAIKTHGTTSAYAENTPTNSNKCYWRWNYLRVRGEYMISRASRSCDAELPPRTRRIRPPTSREGILGGTTSAYAENTEGAICCIVRTRNYLRVRGEYTP